MSIIQDIRDKYAKVTVVLIALALIGFILTDYFQSQSRSMGGSASTTVGVVNGRSIDIKEFNQATTDIEASMKQQGYPTGEGLTEQARTQAWDQQVSIALLEGEFNKLGIDVSKKEIGDILYGANPPQELAQQFTDEKTGQYNAAQAKQALEQTLKKGTQEQKDYFNNRITQWILQRKYEKYNSMFANTVNVPKWFVEKQNADNSQLAKISYVSQTYASIADSTVKVDDKEIADYVNKHKEDFKQEESRNIAFVTFNAAPSAADTTVAKNRIMELKAGFDTTNNVLMFLAAEGVSNYYDGYISGKTIQIAAKDSIFKLPVGGLYGPYIDGNSFVLAKMLGARQMADTARVRHILVSTQQRDTATALKILDTVKLALSAGASFDSICAKYSEDPGSKDKGGLYESVTPGQMVPQFNDYVLGNSVGSKGVVKTDYGYHYIEILSQKGGSTAYKIAYLPKEITTSQETVNSALNDANQFYGEAKDAKAFDASYEKNWKAKGSLKSIATNIKPTDAQVQGLGFSRELVRNIYTTKKGQAVKPERVGDQYVVALVTDVFEEGTQSPATARMMVEPILRNKKKAELLKKKVGAVSTLEAAGNMLNGALVQVADSLRIDSRQSKSLGYEPKILGAVFNPANKGKVVNEALEGAGGVYVIRVDEVTSTPVTAGSIDEQRKMMAQQKQGMLSNPLGALRKAATIKDKRADRF
ncbi:MAG: SurA N-terminal domain-containing protein [Chitinophagaceae bacterium]|nr:SurA N-terminal domain-containing protein [Chitinophagaceae bacterium]